MEGYFNLYELSFDEKIKAVLKRVREMGVVCDAIGKHVYFEHLNRTYDFLTLRPRTNKKKTIKNRGLFVKTDMQYIFLDIGMAAYTSYNKATDRVELVSFYPLNKKGAFEFYGNYSWPDIVYFWVKENEEDPDIADVFKCNGHSWLKSERRISL